MSTSISSIMPPCAAWFSGTYCFCGAAATAIAGPPQFRLFIAWCTIKTRLAGLCACAGTCASRFVQYIAHKRIDANACGFRCPLHVPLTVPVPQPHVQPWPFPWTGLKSIRGLRGLGSFSHLSCYPFLAFLVSHLWLPPCLVTVPVPV